MLSESSFRKKLKHVQEMYVFQVTGLTDDEAFGARDQPAQTKDTSMTVFLKVHDTGDKENNIHFSIAEGTW